MLEGRARWAWDARYARGSSETSIARFAMYIDFELDVLLASCSTHFNYLVIAFIVEAYVISYWSSYDCSLTNLSTKSNSSRFNSWENSDLTTLNTLRMFTSGQRNPAPNIISIATPRTNNHSNDRVKTNKFDVYKGERDELNDWLIQMKLYFAFNSISKNQKTLFAFTYFKEKAQHWFKSKIRSYLDDEKDINDWIFTRFNNFKVAIRRIFEIFNEEQFVEKII